MPTLGLTGATLTAPRGRDSKDSCRGQLGGRTLVCAVPSPAQHPSTPTPEALISQRSYRETACLGSGQPCSSSQED